MNAPGICRLCGESGEAALVGTLAATHPGPFDVSEYRLQRCGAYDVVYLDPLPNERDLDVLYRDSHQFDDPIYTDPDRVAKMLEYYHTALTHRKIVPPAGGSVLEVGAGLAWVSRTVKALDSSIVTTAIDVSDEAIAHCPWVDRYCVGATLDALPDRGPFDLIALTHVIEHLRDPAAVLAQLAQLLSADGALFITAPLRPVGWKPGDGIEAWRQYSYLHVPAHIHYLSREWFVRNGGAAGLSIASWDPSPEQGQAFELVLQRRNAPERMRPTR